MRLHRTSRVSAVAESTLQETLGAEAQVLVIVDPSELPRAFHSIDVLAERIGDSAYRCEALPMRLPHAAPADAATGSRADLPHTWGRDMQAAATALRARHIG